MENTQDPEAAETDQTTQPEVVAHPRLVGRSSKYPRRGNPKDCEFWWYRQSPDHLWSVVMVFWGMEIMERCGNAASFPIDECPGEWIGPIPPPNVKGVAPLPAGASAGTEVKR